MDSSVCIVQKGTVEEIFNHKVRVRIHRESACGQCNAKGICNLSGIAERIIETQSDDPKLKPGDNIEIAISRNMGNKAVLLGYLLPFFLLVTVLIVSNSLGFPEWISGLVSLGILVPYYMFLYLFREKLRRNFTFTIRKKE
jgi:sigma-E factor negative regulatory protein RseC